jgi:hypothetical protein
MKLSQTRIAIVLAILVATSSGCGVINRIRAKNQLNEAARAYREGRFPEEAEQHSREAARTWIPITRLLRCLSRERFTRSIVPACKLRRTLPRPSRRSRLTSRFSRTIPKDDEAYKAIAYLYGAIKEDDKLRQWISARRQRRDRAGKTS